MANPTRIIPGNVIFTNQLTLPANSVATSVLNYATVAGETGVISPQYPVGDVRRYGAKGDGVTDDSAAINAAITSAAGTYDVYFAPATYMVKAISLNIANTRLVGSTGAILKLKQLPSLDGSPILNITASGCEVKYLTLDGYKSVQPNDGYSDSFNGGTNGTGRAYRAAIVAYNSLSALTGLTITDCTFLNTYGAGIATQNTNSIRINRCYANGLNFELGFISSTYTNGVQYITDININNNIVLNTGSGDASVNGNAFIVHQAQSVVVANNIIDNVERDGFKFESCIETTITGNVIRHVTIANFPGISLQGDAIDVVISGNKISDAGCGIQINHASFSAVGYQNVLVTGNIIDNIHAPNTPDGIQFSPAPGLSSQNIQLIGNVFNNIPRYSIYLAISANTSDVSVKSNQITTTGLSTTVGIYSVATGVTVSNVSFVGNHINLGNVATSGGIRFDQTGGAFTNVLLASNEIITGSGHSAFLAASGVVTSGRMVGNLTDGTISIPGVIQGDESFTGSAVFSNNITAPGIIAGVSTALTLTGNAASTWSTSSGLLTLKGASGVTLDGNGGQTISLGKVSGDAISFVGGVTGNILLTSGSSHTIQIQTAGVDTAGTQLTVLAGSGGAGSSAGAGTGGEALFQAGGGGAGSASLRGASGGICYISGGTGGNSAGAGSGNSGGVAIDAGNAGNNASGGPAGNAGGISITGRNGGAGDATNAAGNGSTFTWTAGSAGANNGGGGGIAGAVTITAGSGSAANGSSAATAGALFDAIGGAGGAGSAAAAASSGGGSQLAGGAGGASGGFSAGGNGGTVQFVGAVGGAGSGSSAGGSGSLLRMLGSTGGAAAAGGSGGGGTGSQITLQAGNGGAASTGTGPAGNAGSITIVGGTGGAATTTGAAGSGGGGIVITSGTGGTGASGQAPGIGAGISISGGPAGADGGSGLNANGGSVTINGGAATNSGTPGAINIGTARGAITLGISGGSALTIATPTVNYQANAIWGASSQSATNTTSFQLNPNVADGASSIAVDINTQTTLSTTGALLFRIRNNGTNNFQIDKSGSVTIPATAVMTAGTFNARGSGGYDMSSAAVLNIGASNANQIICGGSNITNGVTINSGSGAVIISGTTSNKLYFSGTQQSNIAWNSIPSNDTTGALLFIGGQTGGVASSTGGGTGGIIQLQGGTGGAGTTTLNPGSGGYLLLVGGNAGTGGTGNATGGSVFIRGGVKQGTGSNGNITIGDSNTNNINIGNATGNSGGTTTTTFSGTLSFPSGSIASTAIITSSTPGNILVDNGTNYVPQAQQTYDVRNYASFAAAVTAIGSTIATLTISSTQAVSASVSVPATLTLEFRGAGQLSVATGQTVTIAGPVVAPLMKIFSLTGTGLVVFANSAPVRVYPQWWGAVGDGVTDCAAAINAATASIRSTSTGVGGTVQFERGVYGITTWVGAVQSSGQALDYNNITWNGVNRNDSIIHALNVIGNIDGSFPPGMVVFEGYTNYSLKNITISNLGLFGYDDHTEPNGRLFVSSNCDGVTFTDNHLENSPVEGAILGVNINNDRNYLVSRCFATHIGGWGHTPGPSWAGPLSAYNITATDCKLVDCDGYQVGMASEIYGKEIQIIGCRFIDCSTGATPAYQTAISVTGSLINSVVSNNVIIKSSLAINLAVASGSGTVSITNNILRQCEAGIYVLNAESPVYVSENVITDVVNLGAGSNSAIQHQNGSSAPMIIKNNVISAGSTGTWAFGICLSDASQYDVVESNTIIGDGFNNEPFIGTSTGAYNSRFVRNTVIPLTMTNTRPRYMWQGITLSKAQIAGIDSGETIISAIVPSKLFGTSAPTVGTWSVGDIMWNTSPTTTGIDHWSCTTAGTPGTWTPVYTNYTGTAPVVVSAGAISVSTMGGASAGSGGSAGLVPAPAAGQQSLFLRGDGYWATAGTGTTTPSTLYTNVTQVTSVTTGTIDGQAYTMPANTLTTDGQMIKVYGNFIHAANTNSTTAGVLIFGAAIGNTGLATSGVKFPFEVKIMRTSSTTATANLTGVTSAGALQQSTLLITGINWASTLVIKSTLTGATTNGDLIADYLRVELWP